MFIDETGTNTKMTRARGRCGRGERLRSKAPFGHWKTQTFVTALRCGAPTAPLVIDAPMDRAIFETYVRTQLVPTLQQGDIVILDNLPAHKSPAAEQAIRDRGAWLMFLSPYSPDLNPIEMAFAKLKAHLRAMAMRTIDELWKAIGQICDLFTPERMRKLLRSRRVWIHLSVRCSSVYQSKFDGRLTAFDPERSFRSRSMNWRNARESGL